MTALFVRFCSKGFLPCTLHIVALRAFHNQPQPTSATSVESTQTPQATLLLSASDKSGIIIVHGGCRHGVPYILPKPLQWLPRSQHYPGCSANITHAQYCQSSILRLSNMLQHSIDDALHLSHTVQPGRNQFSTPPPQEPDRRSALPPYDNCDAYYFSLNPSMAERMAADEESRCGFWGEDDALLEEQKTPRPNTTKRANLSFYKSFSFLLTVLYCISVGNSALCGFDLILTQFGLGFGLARWLVVGPDTSYNVSPNPDVATCLESND
jgi:hypothetical protein